MRKKFKTLRNLFVLFFVIFYPIKSLASTQQCDLFIETLLANPDRSYEALMSDVSLNDFGFLLQQDWNKKEKKSSFRKDRNGNYVIGKINSLELAKK